MDLLRSPRNKLLLATGMVVLLALLAPLRGDLHAATVARILLGLSALAGLAWWMVRQRGASPKFGLNAPPRLKVLSRTGLSQRCGMALVDADGRQYLVVYGDGFAQLHEAKRAPAPARLQARTPRTPRTAPRSRKRAASAAKGGAR